MLRESNLMISPLKDGNIIITHKKTGVRMVVNDTTVGFMIEVVGEGYVELGPNGDCITPDGHPHNIGPAVNAFIKK